MATLGDTAIGGVVKINVNGTAIDFLVVNQGNPDSSIYDSSCDGTWLLMKSLYAEMSYWGSSTTNEYSKSQSHTYGNNTFYNLISGEIRALIKTVKIPYVNGTGSSGTLATGANGLSTKIFSLSGTEVGLSSFYLQSGEGAVLDYFVGASSTTRIAYPLNSSKADQWMLRTPHKSNDTDATAVSKNGSASTVSYGLGGTDYIRPAFVLPSDMSVNDSGFVEPGSSFCGNQNFGGVWEEMDSVWECYNGVWTEIAEGYECINGVWQETN